MTKPDNVKQIIANFNSLKIMSDKSKAEVNGKVVDRADLQNALSGQKIKGKIKIDIDGDGIFDRAIKVKELKKADNKDLNKKVETLKFDSQRALYEAAALVQIEDLRKNGVAQPKESLKKLDKMEKEMLKHFEEAGADPQVFMDKVREKIGRGSPKEGSVVAKTDDSKLQPIYKPLVSQESGIIVPPTQNQNKPPVQEQKAPSAPTKEEKKYTKYVVQNGESPASIAKKFGIPKEQAEQFIKQLLEHNEKDVKNFKGKQTGKEIKGFLVGAEIELPGEFDTKDKMKTSAQAKAEYEAEAKAKAEKPPVSEQKPADFNEYLSKPFNQKQDNETLYPHPDNTTDKAYTSGKNNVVVEAYDVNKKITQKSVYKDGVLESKTIYDPKNKQETCYLYNKDGKTFNKSIVYDISKGEPDQKQINTFDENRQKTTTEYYKDGIKESVLTYKNGVPKNKQILDSQGQVTSEELYAKGKIYTKSMYKDGHEDSKIFYQGKDAPQYVEYYDKSGKLLKRDHPEMVEYIDPKTGYLGKLEYKKNKELKTPQEIAEKTPDKAPDKTTPTYTVTDKKVPNTTAHAGEEVSINDSDKTFMKTYTENGEKVVEKYDKNNKLQNYQKIDTKTKKAVFSKTINADGTEEHISYKNGIVSLGESYDKGVKIRQDNYDEKGNLKQKLYYDPKKGLVKTEKYSEGKLILIANNV